MTEIQHREYSEYAYAAEALRQLKESKDIQPTLEYCGFKFFGERLFNWIYKWVVEIEYKGVYYAFNPPSALEDFYKFSGIDLQYAYMSKEKEVLLMIEYIKARAEQFTDEDDNKLSDVLRKEGQL